MDKDAWATILGYLVLVVLLYLLGIWFFTIVWGWAIPAVFPGMVSQGLLPATLTYGQAFKVLVLYSCLDLFTPSSSSSSKKK